MISRRLLRIKVIQILYAYFMSSDNSVVKYEKELMFSINKAYELYHYILLLVTDIVAYMELRIDIAKQKKIPTYDDLNPDTKFVDNSIIDQIRRNRQLNAYLKQKRISWTNYPELIKKLYQDIRNSENYKKYMSLDLHSYSEDRKIIIDIFENEIATCDLLYQVLEEQSIYWNDDVEFVISMIIKTLNKFRKEDGENAKLMEQFKNEDDKEFAVRLFRRTIALTQEIKVLIKINTRNWDLDRITFMDILLLQTAITEIIEFASIPTKVSFDEYLEIAKFYSTEKSSIFINGVLDKIIISLKKENRILKRGKGLIGEDK